MRHQYIEQVQQRNVVSGFLELQDTQTIIINYVSHGKFSISYGTFELLCMGSFTEWPLLPRR